MNKQFLSILIMINGLIFYTMMTYASNQAKFSLVANTATSISVPLNRNALVQYTVTNNTAVQRTLTMVTLPYATQITTDNSQCANPFTLAHGQSCKLTLSINGSRLQSAFSSGPVVCKTLGNTNLPDKFLCSQPEPQMVLTVQPVPAVTPTINKLYVSNWDGNSISMCYINAGNLQYCHISALSNTFVNPEALAINNNTLFVANIGGGISSCLIDAITGDLSNCQNAVPDPNAPIYAPDGIAILSGQAYISDSGPASFNQGVTVCDIAGSLLTNCNFTQGDATFSVPSDLAIMNNTVYVTNFNSQNVQTTYCTIANPLCTTSSGEGTISGTANLLNEPEGITFSTINANNYAYFTNHGNNTVTICAVPSTTIFTNCTTTSGYFTGFGNLAILTDTLTAFIPSGLKSISMCTVSTIDGSLSNCINSTETNFNNPSGLVIQ